MRVTAGYHASHLSAIWNRSRSRERCYESRVRATQRGPYMPRVVVCKTRGVGGVGRQRPRGRAGAGPAREKSEPRDTRPLTHREGTRATADQAGGLIRRVCCRPPHCFPAAVPLRAVAGGRGGVQEGPPLVQEGSRKGPPCKGLHAPASIARTRGCGGWRRRLGVMTERENLTPSPRREDDWRRAPWCSRPRCWAPLLEEGSELPTRRGGQCLAGCWRGA